MKREMQKMLPVPVKEVLLIQEVYGRYDQSTNVYTPSNTNVSDNSSNIYVGEYVPLDGIGSDNTLLVDSSDESIDELNSGYYASDSSNNGVPISFPSDIDSDVNTRDLGWYMPTIGSFSSITSIGINSLNSYTPTVGSSFDSIDIEISSPESNTALAYELESDGWILYLYQRVVCLHLLNMKKI